MNNDSDEFTGMLRKVLIAARKRPFEQRVKVGLVALLALSVIATVSKELAGTLLFGVDPSMEEVSRHEERFAAVRAMLPTRAVVGFATDAASRSEQSSRFQMTRYALTPAVIVPGLDWPLVIGDFDDPASARELVAQGFTVRQDFGGGVLLLEKPQR